MPLRFVDRITFTVRVSHIILAFGDRADFTENRLNFVFDRIIEDRSK